mmetsp:Transcript_9169/g.34512  ORF Transcript_9169/g.34512 Transcript_9169/m.34512 type:complete len:207 (+) Transcript_9169:467-1087(+)
MNTLRGLGLSQRSCDVVDHAYRSACSTRLTMSFTVLVNLCFLLSQSFRRGGFGQQRRIGVLGNRLGPRPWFRLAVDLGIEIVVPDLGCGLRRRGAHASANVCLVPILGDHALLHLAVRKDLLVSQGAQIRVHGGDIALGLRDQLPPLLHEVRHLLKLLIPPVKGLVQALLLLQLRSAAPELLSLLCKCLHRRQCPFYAAHARRLSL